MKRDQRRLIRGTVQVIKANGKYLMRFETAGINKDCWIFPGGDFELRKDADRRELGAECSIRETQEETGLTPIAPKLRAVIFFDNRRRIFPGGTRSANFDYQAFYYFSDDYSGLLAGTGPDGRKQGFFRYNAASNLPMHEGDREILRALEEMPPKRIFEGVIVHNGSRLESAKFDLV